MCTDCDQAARIWHWGGYQASCPGCATRAVAISPQRIRQDYYEALRTAGADDKTIHDAKSAVGREYARIRDLRAADIAAKAAN